MVQIGNFHLGAANTAVKPKVSFGEAYALWDNLSGRYGLLETLQVFSNYTHDQELKDVIDTKIIKVMAPQIEFLEQILLKYQLPLPPRPPKDVRFEADSGTEKDEFIFRRLFSLIQDFINVCAVSIKIMVVNDEIRDRFAKYLLDKIELFDYLYVFGLNKGWLEIPPMMTNR
jgi:hypothetical protein